MAEEASSPVQTNAAKPSRKRKLKRSNKSSDATKRSKDLQKYQRASKKVRDDKKTRRLFRKRIREYNSDDDDGDVEGERKVTKGVGRDVERRDSGREEVGDDWDADLEDESAMNGDSSEDEGMQLGITKFTEGCRAFKMAFMKIMKKSTSTDSLGPILSAHKKLVAEKLAEEAAEQRAKGEAKKEKHMAGEKGHVLPPNFLDSKEKFLISVATKGVVKLFNAVNKAQNSQRGLNTSKSKDARVLAKRRKEAFLSELRKSTTEPNRKGETDDTEPGWAPLRDSYMLGNPKLKDWDKMPDPTPASGSYKTPLESSSDDD